MDNLGLLAGLANGVKEGMLAYQTQKQIRRQQDMENLNRGVVEDPDTGELRYTPEMQQKLQKQQELQNLQLEKLKKELGGEGSLEDQYKKAQIDYLRSKMGTESARAGLLGAKEKGLVAPKAEKAMKEEKLPSATYTAGGFAQRIEDANKQLEQLQQKFDPTTLRSSVEGSSWMPQIMKSENIKLLDQAKRNFINAVLRRESGAAISPSEFENAESQYFPSAGDTKTVLEQKKRNRDVALATLKAEGQRALPQIQESLQPQDAGLIPKAQSVGVPKPGTVEGGYKFKGGDPSNPKNWEAM